MDYREQGSHAQGVYPTQDTANLEQEEEADIRIIARDQEDWNWRIKVFKQSLARAKDLTIELFEG